MTTPEIVPAPSPHKQSLTEAAVALVASGGTVASLHQFAGATFPAQTAAVTAVVFTVLAAARKELPWLRQLLIWARALKKNKQVTSSAPYRELQAQLDALTKAVPAPVAAAAEVVAHDVVAAAEAPPVATVTVPAPPTGPVLQVGPTPPAGNEVLHSIGIN